MEKEIDQRFIFQEKMINEEKSFQKAYETIFGVFKNRICTEYKTNDKLVQVTFSEYDEFIRKIACKLDNYLGDISKGEWVALKYDNHPNWLALFWALLMVGYKVLLIDCKHNNELTNYIMRQAGANAIICPEDNKINHSPFLHVSFEKITTVDETNKFCNETWENEIAFCTSGTTGTSKIFVYNGKNFINQLSISKYLCKDFDIMIDKNGDKILSMLPLHHIFGFVLVNLILSFGGRVIYPKNKSPKAVMEACKEHGVTWLPSVPIFWDGIIKSFKNRVNQLGINEVSKLEELVDASLNLEKNDNYNNPLDNKYMKEYFNNLFGSELKICISGGGHISKESLGILNAFNYYFMNGYGSTETGVVAVCNTYSVEKRISGSIGTIFDNVEYGILQTDDFTKKGVIKKEGTGELLIASEFLHSARMEDGKAVLPEMYDNKWYCTGDIVTIKGDYLYIEGRIKDVIVNSSGENVYPDELEEYFNNLPHCSNICAIGMKDDELNDLTALILNISTELNDKESISEIASSFANINEKLPNYKRVHKVLISKESMPMANEIKIKRLKLREMIECNEYNYEILECNLNDLAYDESAVSACENKDNTMETIDVELFNKIKNEAKITISQTTGLGVDEIKDDHHLVEDLGMSSLNMMELFLQFEDEYNILIPDTEYYKFMTVNDFSYQVLSKVNLQ